MQTFHFTNNSATSLNISISISSSSYSTKQVRKKTMVASCLSLVSLYGGFLRRSLSAAGLKPSTVTLDGGATQMRYWGPTSDSLSEHKPSLVLIHGFGPHGAWQWRPQIGFFSGEFNLYVPELLFFGPTSSTELPDRSEVFQAVCVGKLMEKIGVERYSVVGTSYGGFVAYNMAAMWPERVEKVVIASSDMNYGKDDQAALLKRAGAKTVVELMLPATAKMLRTLMKLSVYRCPYYLPEFILNDFLEKLYGENRKEKLELLKGLTTATNDEVAYAKPLEQEVLLVWGDSDQIFLVEKAKLLKECLGEKARLEILKNASHVPQLEQSWQFNKVVKKFLCGS